MLKVGLSIMWGTGQKKFTYKYTTFIVFTFKVPDKFISWTSRKTNFYAKFYFFFPIPTVAGPAFKALPLLIYF